MYPKFLNEHHKEHILKQRNYYITLTVAAYREEDDSLNFSQMSPSKSVWNIVCTIFNCLLHSLRVSLKEWRNKE